MTIKNNSILRAILFFVNRTLENATKIDLKTTLIVFVVALSFGIYVTETMGFSNTSVFFKLLLPLSFVFQAFIMFPGFKKLIAILKMTLLTKSSVIHSPPGHRLVSLFRFLFTKDTFNSVFAQTIGNMRQEYYEALQDGDLKSAKYIRFQIYPVLLSTLVVLLFAKFGKTVSRLWKIL